MLNDNNFKKDLEMLSQNVFVKKLVMKELLDKGLDKKLKGFLYLLDLITLALLKKNYSRTTPKELYPILAHKYGIKEYSIQRQLRYTCTIACEKHYKPDCLAQEIWFKVKTILEKKGELFYNEGIKVWSMRKN